MATRHDIDRNFAGFVSLVAIPAVFAALGAYNDKLKEVFGANGVSVIWIGTVVILFASSLRLHLPERSIHSLLVENEDLHDQVAEYDRKIDQLDGAIGLLTLQTSYCESARATVLSYMKSGIKDIAGLVSAFDDLASPIYLENEAIFGFGSSERWSFAIYLYSSRNDNLVSVWRKRATNHGTDGPGRDWQRGQGHVGKAFVDGRAIITGDSQNPDIAELTAAPESCRRQYDESLYVSFAAIPIGPILPDDAQPYGVLVGTSDRQGRFDRENSGILVQVAGSIASILITAGVDIDQLQPNNEGAI